ncbi:MAG: hypothetical protein K5637_00280 [Lachnospiraceae bacterium]|nr:hypothetical protein [Lachnospiraceae bacterium]
MKKIFSITALLFLAVSLSACARTAEATEYSPDAESAAARHVSLFEGKSLSYEGKDGSDNELLLGDNIYSDGNYNYYEDEAGFIEWIELIGMKDFGGYAEGEEDCSSEAEDMFYKVFEGFLAEGSSLEITKEPFNGAANVVTISEIFNGIETGNHASLTFAKNKKLILGSFIEADQQLLSEIVNGSEKGLTAEAAFEYAKQAIIDDIQEVYGYKAELSDDLFDSCTHKVRTWNGRRFWEFDKVVVWTYFPEWAERDDGTFPEVYTIQIDYKTGECIELANTSK